MRRVATATTVWILTAGVAFAAESFVCPEDESTGKFADPDECDKWWNCFRGEAEVKYCKDGWGFDPNRVLQAEPCDYLFNVDCTGRETLGEPLGTGVCFRENGIYEHEDPGVCDKYYSCTDNTPTLLSCSPLHFRPDTKTCDWPQAANRGNCSSRNTLNGFTCDPTQEYFTKDNQKVAHPRFPHPDDCTKFYVCKNGVEPAISGCDEGLVFSVELSACDEPANVPECNPDYFGDYPAYEEEAAPAPPS